MAPPMLPGRAARAQRKVAAQYDSTLTASAAAGRMSSAAVAVMATTFLPGPPGDPEGGDVFADGGGQLGPRLAARRVLRLLDLCDSPLEGILHRDVRARVVHELPHLRQPTASSYHCLALTLVFVRRGSVTARITGFCSQWVIRCAKQSPHVWNTAENRSSTQSLNLRKARSTSRREKHS